MDKDPWELVDRRRERDVEEILASEPRDDDEIQRVIDDVLATPVRIRRERNLMRKIKGE